MSPRPFPKMDTRPKIISTILSPRTQDVDRTYIRHSEDVQDIFFWTSYVCSIYVLCSGASWCCRSLTQIDPLNIRATLFWTRYFRDLVSSGSHEKLPEQGKWVKDIVSCRLSLQIDRLQIPYFHIYLFFLGKLKLNIFTETNYFGILIGVTENFT